MSESTPRGRRYGEGRQALIEATIRVVARFGLRGLTHRAVAREAGVTHGLVTFHFGSRQELIREALVVAARESIERSALDPASGSLADLVATLPSLVASDEEGQAFQFELALEARRNPDLLPAARELYRAYLDATADSLRHLGIEAGDDLTRLVFAALDGLVFQQLLFGDPQQTERSIAELRTILAQLRLPVAG
ncbi:MAG: TetR/AcrR family transcriptional regulator [Gaiella sp.]